jgi:glycosyltransferase involved in cell wall biosynthesis
VKATRVGLVIGQLTAGGAEGQVATLGRGLHDSREFVPVVYCLSEQTAPYGPLIEAAGVRVSVIAGGRLARVRRLRQALARDRIDVVHAWLFIANAYAWLANRGTGRPLVTSARNCKRQGRALDWLNRGAFAASDAIVVNSLGVADYIRREYGARAARTTVVYNAVDTDRFTPARAVHADGPCVAMVGRLVPQKNPLLFVAAAAALRAHIPNVRFMLIGGGPLLAQVSAAVAAANLQECCVLLGERHDVPALLREADLFWLTSDWEGLPNVVLEAMASGLPVVVTDVGGARELVRPGEDGFLIRGGDCDALVTHSVDLLADPVKRRCFARAARARAEQFAPQQMVASMQRLYRRVLEQRTQ